jgi:hypothetical protein
MSVDRSAETTIITIKIFSNKRIADFGMLGKDIILNALEEINGKPVDVMSFERTKGKGTFGNDTMITKVDLIV